MRTQEHSGTFKGKMDPNSGNQLWSRWEFTVIPGVIRERPFRDVKYNAAKFTRKAFGSATEMNIQWDGKSYIFRIRTEGTPAHDPQIQKYFLDNFTKFFQNGFGMGTRVSMNVRIEAGDIQNGKPPDQLIILPSII